MRKYTPELTKDVRAVFSGDRFQGVLKGLKEASEENGTFEAVASTDDVDRHNERVLQEGIDTKNWEKNSVILYGHDSWELPVGLGTEIWEEKKGKSTRTKVKGVFAGHDMAQDVRKLYDMGFSAMSIGFIPKEYDKDERTIKKSELLEISFVAIPANPKAVKDLKEKGFDVDTYIKKGLIKTTDPVQEEEEKGEPKEEEPKEEEEKVEEKAEEKSEEQNEEEKKEEKEEQNENNGDHETISVNGFSINSNVPTVLSFANEQDVVELSEGIAGQMKEAFVSKEDVVELEKRLNEKIGVLESGIEKLVNASLEDTKEVKEKIKHSHNRKKIQNAVSGLSSVLQDIKV